MPFVDNQGIRIHYEVEGAGPALVMQHGSGSSLQDWYQFGYVESLKSHCQLILVDARGFGGSDKPHEEAAYVLHLRVSDLVAVLDDLGIEEAGYWGYSMGGWIGFGMAKFAARRISSLILGGAHPYADSAEVFRHIDGTDSDAFVSAMEKFTGLRITGESRKQLLENDLRAFAASMQDRDSMEEILPAMKMPCLLFAGENDPRLPKVEKCARCIPEARFMSLPGLDHEQAFNRSDLLIPHVTSFLQRV